MDIRTFTSVHNMNARVATSPVATDAGTPQVQGIISALDEHGISTVIALLLVSPSEARTVAAQIVVDADRADRLEFIERVRRALGKGSPSIIAAMICEALNANTTHEFTVNSVFDLGREKDFYWVYDDIFSVLELARGATILERIYINLQSDPPVEISPVEVAQQLGASGGMEWTRNIKVVYRARKAM